MTTNRLHDQPTRTSLAILAGLLVTGCGSATAQTPAGIKAAPTKAASAPKTTLLAARITYPEGAPNMLLAVRDQRNRIATKASLTGEPYLLVFVNAGCGTHCQTSLRRLHTATAESKTRVLLVSTTPKTDTPPAVKELLTKIQLDTPNVSYAARPVKSIRRILRLHGYTQTAVNWPTIQLIVARGKLRAEYHAAFSPGDVAHDVALLTAEP